MSRKKRKVEGVLDYSTSILFLTILFVALFTFAAPGLTGSIILGVKNDTNLVKEFQASGVKPKIAYGYYLDEQELDVYEKQTGDSETVEKLRALGIGTITPFVKVGCTKNMCFKNVFYKCEEGGFQKVAKCKYGCDEQGCKECVQWEKFDNLKGVSPRIRGSDNKCIGEDLYQCIDGRWKFTLTCTYGCITSPITKRVPEDNKQKIDDKKKAATGIEDAQGLIFGRPPKAYVSRWGEEDKDKYTFGHCRCFYGYNNICVGPNLFRCLGYKDNYYYTNIKRCEFGCKKGKCIRGRTTCDSETQKPQCLGGKIWACKDGFWLNTKQWCSIRAEHKKNLQDPLQNDIDDTLLKEAVERQFEEKEEKAKIEKAPVKEEVVAQE
jgi:hypothetical protein